MSARIDLPVAPTQVRSCCSTAVRGGLEVEAAENLARVFKALSDPNRVRLISLIAAAEDSEACVCDLTDPVGLSQPTVSHHMRVLVEAGLVSREQRGRWVYFSLEESAFAALREAISFCHTPSSGDCSA